MYTWFFVQLLILFVIVKYEKPIEDDDSTLIHNQLLKVYQQMQADDADDELRFQRRMKAYEAMADQQIDMIVRAMVSYSGGRTFSSSLMRPLSHIDGLDGDLN